MKNKEWIAVAVDLPELYKKVLVCDYRVEGKPELDNVRITYLTKDCNTQELKWFGERQPDVNNELWQYLPEPPLKFEITRQVTVMQQEQLKRENTIRYPHH
jgi:hypothetical protein